MKTDYIQGIILKGNNFGTDSAAGNKHSRIVGHINHMPSIVKKLAKDLGLHQKSRKLIEHKSQKHDADLSDMLGRLRTRK